MANKIDIIIDAIDNASGAINNVNSSLEGLDNEQKKGVKSSLALGAGLAVAGAAIGAIVDYTKKAISKTVDYTQDVDDLSRSIGVNREETSRLLQVSQSLAISQKNLGAALEYAAKNGVDVSIAGIKNLAYQYETLNSYTEKTSFLTETFGNNGAEMGRLLEQGSSGVDEMTRAVSDSLVITDAAYQATQDYIETQERLKDVQESIDYSIGRVAMEGWTQVLLGINVLLHGYTTEMNGAAGATRGFNYVNQYTPQFLEETTEPLTGVTNLFREMTEQMIFAAAAEGLTAEQATDLAIEMGLLDFNTKFAYTSIESLKNKLKDGEITLEEYNERVATLAETMNGIHDRTATITIRGEIEDSAYEAMAFLGQGPINPYIGLPENQRAVGGAVAPNVPYLVGENGPEIFKPNNAGSIIPNGQIGGYGGGSEIDYDRLTRAMVEALERSSFAR